MSRGLQVFEYTRAEVVEWMWSLWVPVDTDLCGRQVTQDLPLDEFLTREQYRNLDSCRRALRRPSQPWRENELANTAPTASELRARLLTLVPGVRHDINGVPVRRLPCAGNRFDVGVCWEPHDERWQRLRLADAISRVRSGHYPRLGNPPGMSAYWTARAESDRTRRNAEIEFEERGDCHAVNSDTSDPILTFATQRMFEGEPEANSVGFAELDAELARIRSHHDALWRQTLSSLERTPEAAGQLMLDI